MYTRQLAPAVSTLLLLLTTACPTAAGEASDDGASAVMSAMLSALAGPAAAAVPAAPQQSAAPAGGGDDLSIAQKLMAALASVEGGASAGGSSADVVVPGSAAKSLLNAVTKQKLLDVHNCLRSTIAKGLVKGLPSAANMALMEWDDRLATTANDWAGQCAAKPDSPTNRAVNGLTFVAQSVATDWLNDVDRMVRQWFDQRPASWDPVNGGGGGEDFRRLASASSRLLGCALQDCRRASGFAVLLVCNYGGGGSAAPVGLPYAPGAACRACPAVAAEGPARCMQGLCASERECAAAAAAASCSDAPCIDDPDCAGQQPAFCRSDAAVSKCPKLCAACGWQQRDAGYKLSNAGNIIARVQQTVLT